MKPSGTVSAIGVAPIMRYRDPTAAVKWLCDAFGFEKVLVADNANGGIAYAELGFGNSVVMLGAVGDSGLDALMTQPDEIGGRETQSCYLTVEDIDAHYARAMMRGAEALIPLDAAPGSSRGYAARDLEGHIWSFGTYAPRKIAAAPAAPKRARSMSLSAMLASLALVAAGSVAVWGTFVDQSFLVALNSQRANPTLRAAIRAKAAAENQTVAVRELLAREQRSRELAEAAANMARDTASQEITRERTARLAAEAAAREIRSRLASEQSARDAAERDAQEARERLAILQSNSKTKTGNVAAARIATTTPSGATGSLGDTATAGPKEATTPPETLAPTPIKPQAAKLKPRVARKDRPAGTATAKKPERQYSGPDLAPF